MKRKLTTYLFTCAFLAAGTAGGIQVFGQSGRDQNRPPSSSQITPPPAVDYSDAYSKMMRSSGVQSYPVYPMVGWTHIAQSFTVVTKDGTIERINKEPGIQLSKEEFDQVNETRQKIQIAVTQIRSSDTDESKRKDAKNLVAKYLKVEFQVDQDSRRNQVERLEKHVEQLRSQLVKREESQDKLIELRMQLLENDASGLSFPDSWGNLSSPPPFNYVQTYPEVYANPSSRDAMMNSQYYASQPFNTQGFSPYQPPQYQPQKIAPSASGQRY